MSMPTSSFFYRHLAVLATVVLSACTTTEAPRTAADVSRAPVTAPIRLLAFGDTGYHYDYLDAEDYQTVVTEQQFLATERQDWIDDKRPIGELAYPPMYRLPGNGSMVAASGLAPVAAAMRDYCVDIGCDFAAMLGDNIYPDGATGGADGRDADRFRDLFMTPFAPLANEQKDFRIYTVLGNHDWRTSRAGAMAQVRFMESTPPFYMAGLFYRVAPPAAHGQLEIFAIDTEVILAGTTVHQAHLADDASELPSDRVVKPLAGAVPQSEAEKNMVRWLEQALASSNARWKIVIGHHPLWSTSGSKFEQARALRRLILPTLCRYADAYLAGHEHTLEVHSDDCSQALPGERVAPLAQVVSGSAAKMRPTNSAFVRHQLAANPQLRTLYAKGLVWGFAHFTFDDERVTVRILETPSDGGAVAKETFQHSFARRSRGEP